MAFEDCCWLFECNKLNRGIIRLDFDEAALLWKTVKKTGGPILEIGRAKGGSTVLILDAAIPMKRKITSIDLNSRHSESCQEIFEESKKFLILKTGDSGKISINGKYGMIFFDGGHDFKSIRSDVLRYWNKLESFEGKPPLAVFHDAVFIDRESSYKKFVRSGDRGVVKVCTRLKKTGVGREISRAGTLIVMQKIRSVKDKDLDNTR